MTNYQTRIAQIGNRKASNIGTISESTQWLDYVLEAICPVNSSITHEMISQCNALELELKKAYTEQEVSADFLISGGTLLNTHISEKDTIDLFIIYKGYGNSENTLGNNKIHFQEIIALRNYTCKRLRTLYPEAVIDDSQPLVLEMSTKSMSNYAIRLFFGQWHNNTSASGFTPFAKQVKLLNCSTSNFIECNPAKSLHELDKKDKNTNGNVRSLARILKNLVADSDLPEQLSGYEITSIIYSMEDLLLAKPSGQLLFLLLECNLFIKKIIEDSFARRMVKSAEGNFVFENANEETILVKLTNLKKELENLLKHLVLEIDLYSNIPLKTAN